MGRLPPTETTIKRLFSLSGNQCAMPDCPEKLIQDDIVIGEICHIEAANEKGPRYRKDQNEEERRSFDNLVLLCPKHHKLSDDVEKFPVEKLQGIKKNHEEKFQTTPFEIPENQFKNIYSQILNKLDQLEKDIHGIKSDTTTIIQKNDEILDLLVNDKIENIFDLRKSTADVVLAKMTEVLKKINSSSDEYDFTIQGSNDKTSIEFIHKDFQNMKKEGMLFNTKLKLTKSKSESLHDLLKNSQDGKITFEASEIEQITISKDDKIVYVINGVTDGELAIKVNSPKPRMLKIVVTGENVEYENIVCKAEKQDETLLISNKDQLDYPLSVQFEIDKTQEHGKFNFSAREDVGGILEAYEYHKFMNALLRRKLLNVVDQESNKTIFEMKINTESKEQHPKTVDLLRKLVIIQEKTDVSLPWPPENLNQSKAGEILAVHDIVTTGKTIGKANAIIVVKKNEKEKSKFIEGLKKNGYLKGKISVSISHILNILGKEIELGPFSANGKMTSDEPPEKIIQEYDVLKTGEEMSFKIIFLEGKGEIIYTNWLP